MRGGGRATAAAARSLAGVTPTRGEALAAPLPRLSPQPRPGNANNNKIIKKNLQTKSKDAKNSFFVLSHNAVVILLDSLRFSSFLARRI